MQLQFVTQLNEHQNKALCCSFGRDGISLASAGNEKNILIWTVSRSNSELVAEYKGHTYFVCDVTFSKGEGRKLLASASLDHTIRIWAVGDYNEFVCTLKPQGETAFPTSVDFHPKQDILVSSDSAGFLRIWRLSDKKEIFTIPKAAMKQARFQPGTGKLLAAGYESVINVYDYETKKLSFTLTGHKKPVNYISWNTQKTNLLVSASEDSVRVWDLDSTASNKCIKLKAFNGHERAHCCLFHPEKSDRVIIGSYKFIYVWDYQQDKHSNFQAHEGIVSSLQASPSSGLLASTSHDQSIKIWQL